LALYSEGTQPECRDGEKNTGQNTEVAIEPEMTLLLEVFAVSIILSPFVCLQCCEIHVEKLLGTSGQRLVQSLEL
jgi:hypothetical protein